MEWQGKKEMPGRGVQGINGTLVRPATLRQGGDTIALEKGEISRVTEAGVVRMFFITVSWCFEVDGWLREAGIDYPNKYLALVSVNPKRVKKDCRVQRLRAALSLPEYLEVRESPLRQGLCSVQGGEVAPFLC